MIRGKGNVVPFSNIPYSLPHHTRLTGGFLLPACFICPSLEYPIIIKISSYSTYLSVPLTDDNLIEVNGRIYLLVVHEDLFISAFVACFTIGRFMAGVLTTLCGALMGWGSHVKKKKDLQILRWKQKLTKQQQIIRMLLPVNCYFNRG